MHDPNSNRSSLNGTLPKVAGGKEETI